MKTVRIALLLGIAILVALPCRSVERVRKTAGEKIRVGTVFSSEGLSRIDDCMKKAINDQAVPFVVCYVSYKGKDVYVKSFGKTDLRGKKSIKRDAIFRMEAQTALITTLALMTLYEEGKFDLDDPVKQYLPEFSQSVVRLSGSYEGGDLVTRPANGDVTIRQLLSHTSGIAYDTYDQDVRAIFYNDSDSTVTTEEIVRRMSRLPLKFDPGTGFVKGFGMEVAGRLAEVVSGKRLDKLIEERILEPLDMKNTHFYLTRKASKRLVPLYQKSSQEDSVSLSEDSLEQVYPLSSNRRFFGGGSGMSGTIDDFSHVCEMILDGGVYNRKRILSRKTIEQMSSDQLFGVSGKNKYGLGLEIVNRELAVRSMKSKGSLFGSGCYGTEFIIDPKENLIILFYTNKVSWYTDRVYQDFVRQVYMSLY